MNLSLNSHYWGVLVSLELIHAMLRITLWLQDVLVALSLSLLMLVRESLVSFLGLFWSLLVGGVRIVFDPIFFVWYWIIFFLLWLSRYSSVASIKELTSQNLIKAQLCSHCDCTILLNLLFYLSLVNSFHNGNVLVFFSFMTSYNVSAPPSQPDAEYAYANDEPNKPKDTANNCSFDLVSSAVCDFIVSLIGQWTILNRGGINYQTVV